MTQQQEGGACCNMSSALQVEPDIGLQEILEISQSRQYSVQYSPFLKGPGGQLGGTIIRQAAPWKGKDEEYLEEHHPDVYEGLQSAKQMAQQKSGTNGVAIVETNGEVSIMSKAAGELAEEGNAGGEVLGTYESYNDALDDYAAMGERAHMPAIA